jgi:hypothetical protein
MFRYMEYADDQREAMSDETQINSHTAPGIMGGHCRRDFLGVDLARVAAWPGLSGIALLCSAPAARESN